MRTLYFDTETTGLVKDKPHIVQLAAILEDGDQIVASVNFMCQPDGWTIPSKASDVHGITTDRANEFGFPEEEILASFHKMLSLADVLVAHNMRFDLEVMTIAFRRFAPEAKCGSHLKTICTMERAKEIMKLPPTPRMRQYGRGDDYKNPSLAEAYKYFSGRELKGAHDAMTDVRACRFIYKSMRSWR